MNLNVCSILFLCVMLASCTPAPNVTNNENEQEPTPHKVLAQWLGDWKTEVVWKRAEWTPKEKRTTGRIQAKWILGKKFVEEVSVGKNLEIEHRYLLGYDPKKKVYRSWFFVSDGTFLESPGSWNAQTKTMTFKSDYDGTGVSGVDTFRFLDADTYEWTTMARDKTGKLYLHLHGKHRRVR